jgi:RimJ/RimL family protein N-acetyltransferase
MGSFIVTDRLELCPLDIKHVTDEYIGWLNDKDVCRFNGHHYFPYTKDAAVKYIEHVSGNKNIIALALHLKDKQVHIGNVSIGDIDFLNRSASLNIILGSKENWNKGYAVEALDALLKHAFFELNLNRISCGTLEGNIGMQKVALKLGMAQEGVKRFAIYKNGSYHNMIEYSIIFNEYMERHIEERSI